MGRILGLDVGEKRIGIALSDPSGMIASPLQVLVRNGWKNDCALIFQLCAEHNVDYIVCGLPRNTNGSEGFQAKQVRDFAQQLVIRGAQVVFTDERYSTVSAENILIEGGVSRKDRKNLVDKVAASYILQQYLDTKAFQAKQTEENQMTENNGANFQDESMMEEEFDDIIELTDQDGEVTRFQYLATLEKDEREYVVLMVLDDADDEEAEEGEVVILEIKKDENGEDYYASLEDELLSEELFQEFLSLADEDPEED